jgi:ADP-heptose:LPS heptosyltransferase
LKFKIGEEVLTIPELTLRQLRTVEKNTVTPDQLRFMAFNGDYSTVYSLMTQIPSEERINYSDKYILFETIAGSVKKLSELINRFEDLLVKKEKKFLLDILNFFISESRRTSDYSRHLFLAIVKVSEELIRISEFNLAIEYLNKALALGVNKYPELKTDVLFRLADLHNRQGNLLVSGNYLNQLLDHPYLITDRNSFAQLIHNISQVSLKQGYINRYKNLLFLGLRYFYTNPGNRRKIYEQIRLTYRRSAKVIFNSDVKFLNRIIFFIHWVYFKVPDLSKLKLRFINKISQRILLGIIYLINYAQKAETVQTLFRNETENFNSLYLLKGNECNKDNENDTSRAKKILITRAMGGIGDLLMMTPAIHALKIKYPDSEINLAIPRRYFPVFEGNDDVELIDIDGDFFTHLHFHKWYNLTDCPAARKESMTAPKVKKSRIDIFASAMNINFLSRSKISRKPRYFLSAEELRFASQFRSNHDLNEKTVIGVQLHSDETYRDYPLMEKLVMKLAEKYAVLIFDNETINGFEFKNIIKVQNLPIRKAFAIAHKCNAIIAPDSSFIHFAAAFDIPTIALFGPIDGKVRTKHYPNCTYLSAKELFGCMPCWRNESIPCKLTGMRTSECMKEIPVNQIVHVLEKKLNGEKLNV